MLQKFSQQPGLTLGAAQRVSVHGNSASSAEFQAQDQSGAALAGRVMYLSYGGTTYQLLGYSPAAKYPEYSAALAQSMQSFDRLTDAAALDKQPMHLNLVRLPRAMTIEEFYRAYPSAVRLEVVAAINDVALGSTLPAGTMAKRVQ